MSLLNTVSFHRASFARPAMRKCYKLAYRATVHCVVSELYFTSKIDMDTTALELRAIGYTTYPSISILRSADTALA